MPRAGTSASIRLLLLALCALQCCALARAAAAPRPAATDPAALHAGQSLADALTQLRRGGLDLLFSSALVGEELRVRQVPAPGSAEQVAIALLAEHSLVLRAIRPGRFVVARAPAAPAAPAATAPPVAEPRLEEVAVYASRYRVAADDVTAPVALTRAEVQALPGVEDDALRVTRYLPGTAGNGLSARSNVRGGRDNELAVYFDGVPLYEPFHYKDFQALLGLVDPSAIARIDYLSGVFPARYGERLSGVLDIAPRAPVEVAEHEIGASLLYAHALSVGRTQWRDAPLDWLVSLRQSTAELAIKAADRDGIDPHFVDALLRLERPVGEAATLTAGLIWLDDELEAQSDDDTQRTLSSYRDRTGWLRWRHEQDAERLEVQIAHSERHTNRTGALDRPGNVTGQVRDDRKVDSTQLRLAWERSGEVRGLAAGLEFNRHEADYDYASAAAFDSDLAALFGRATQFQRVAVLQARGTTAAAWVSSSWALAPRWRANLGARLDAQRHEIGGATVFDDRQWSPRAALEFRPRDSTTLRLSLGQVAQTERPDELLVADGEPVFHAAQRATQAVLGLEQQLGSLGTLRLEAYRKNIRAPSPRYENLLDPVALLPELEVDRRRVAPTDSHLYGLEASLRWAAGEAWSGWFNYTWSEASDQFNGFEVPRSWNQQHAVVAGVVWSRGRWQLSGNVGGHSGWARNALLPSTTNPLGVELSTRNSRRWRPFLSLDLRASWRRVLSRGALRVSGELINATNRGNECCERIEVERGSGAPVLDAERRDWLPRYLMLSAAWELP